MKKIIFIVLIFMSYISLGQVFDNRIYLIANDSKYELVIYAENEMYKTRYVVTITDKDLNQLVCNQLQVKNRLVKTNATFNKSKDGFYLFYTPKIKEISELKVTFTNKENKKITRSFNAYKKL